MGAACSYLYSQNCVLHTKVLQVQQEPLQDEKLFTLDTKHLETWVKGYGLSCPSCSAQECILHRSAHLPSVSAFLVQEELCCSKHIRLFPLPEDMLTVGGNRCSARTDTAVSIQHLDKGTR